MLVSHKEILEKLRKTYPFYLSETESLKGLIDHVEIVFFEAKTLIYPQGASASCFYVIFEGDVEILVEKSQSINRLNILYEGNCFGEDVIMRDTRISSARVIKNTILIKIPKDIFIKFIESQADLKKAFLEISQTYLNLFNYKLYDLPNETVYYLGRPHPFSFAIKIIISFIVFFVLLIGILIATSIGWFTNNAIWMTVAIILGLLTMRLIWVYLEWMNNYFVITGKRVSNFEKRLIKYNNKFEIPLSAITHLEQKMNVWGREIGFGMLVIRTYTGETTLNNVTEPAIVHSLLEYLMRTEKDKTRNDERQSFENFVSEKLISKSTSSQIDPVKEEASASNGMEADRLSVVYRTHWIILLKRILVPLSGFISLLLLILYILVNGFLISNLRWFFALCGILIAISLAWIIYQFVDWRNDQFHITQDLVIDLDRKPFGTENKRTAVIQNIQSIRFEKKGLLGMAFNFGTVYLRVGDEELTFNDVPKPAEIQARLFQALEMVKTKIRKSELADQQYKVAEWIDTYNRVKDKTIPRDINN